MRDDLKHGGDKSQGTYSGKGPLKKLAFDKTVAVCPRIREKRGQKGRWPTAGRQAVIGGATETVSTEEPERTGCTDRTATFPAIGASKPGTRKKNPSRPRAPGMVDHETPI